MTRDHSIYRADITAGSLKVRETRVIAGLMLKDLDNKQWKTEIFDQNVLQVNNAETSRRYVRLIRQRLELMTSEIWKLIRDGSAIVATQATLAAAIKHSRLLGDFMDLIIRDHYQTYKSHLTRSVWNDYLSDCNGRDPNMPEWSESTRDRLRRSVYHILTQAGYLESSRSLKLQPVHIAPEVIRYLEKHNETYVLRCMEVSP